MRIARARYKIYLRHETGCKSHEEPSDGRREAREIASNAAAQGEQAGEEGNNGKEESDQVEDPGESRHEVVVVTTARFGQY